MDVAVELGEALLAVPVDVVGQRIARLLHRLEKRGWLDADWGDEFRSLQKRLGITTLYVTHDQDEAMALSDRVVLMRSGKILQAGPPQDIYQRPNSEIVAAFFGAPLG